MREPIQIAFVLLIVSLFVTVGAAEVFENACTGELVAPSGSSALDKCKSGNHNGKTLVQCNMREGQWREAKVIHCETEKDRTTIRRCNVNQRTVLINDDREAKERLLDVQAELSNELLMEPPGPMKDRLEILSRRLVNINTALRTPRIAICGRGSSNARAYIAKEILNPFNPERKRVWYNPPYFTITSSVERASIIVHETTHYRFGTNDRLRELAIDAFLPSATSASCDADTKTFPASIVNNFYKMAEYYEYIIECGLFVPVLSEQTVGAQCYEAPDCLTGRCSGVRFAETKYCLYKDSSPGGIDAICAHNNQCASKNCSGDLFAGFGSCVGLLEVGEQCNRAANCVEGRCGGVRFSSAKFCLFKDRDPGPNGSWCAHNKQCESRNCIGNLTVSAGRCGA